MGALTGVAEAWRMEQWGLGEILGVAMPTSVGKLQ
jgi:hypothetical protein